MFWPKSSTVSPAGVFNPFTTFSSSIFSTGGPAGATIFAFGASIAATFFQSLSSNPPPPPRSGRRRPLLVARHHLFRPICVTNHEFCQQPQRLPVNIPLLVPPA